MSFEECKAHLAYKTNLSNLAKLLDGMSKLRNEIIWDWRQIGGKYHIIRHAE